MVFGELFIKKLSLAVRAFDHTFISIYLIWSAVERLYLAITPLNLYFYQLLIFLQELWRFSSITLLLVLSKLVVIELFDTFRVVDFKTKSPEALTADATLIELLIHTKFLGTLKPGWLWFYFYSLDAFSLLHPLMCVARLSGLKVRPQYLQAGNTLYL